MTESARGSASVSATESGTGTTCGSVTVTESAIETVIASGTGAACTTLACARSATKRRKQTIATAETLSADQTGEGLHHVSMCGGNHETLLTCCCSLHAQLLLLTCWVIQVQGLHVLVHRERDRVEGERSKQARPERSSSAAANGRSSRSPSKHSRRNIDWGAYKRGREADDPVPGKHREMPLDDRELAPMQEAKRGRRDRSYSSSDDRE